MSDLNFIENKSSHNESRSLSRQYINASMDDKALRLVSVSSIFSTQSVSVPTGSTTIFNSIFSSSDRNPILHITGVAIFIGSTSTPLLTLLPGGSGIAWQNYRVFGPIMTPFRLEGTPAAEHERIIRTGVVNNSGSTQTISIKYQMRYIINRGGSISED